MGGRNRGLPPNPSYFISGSVDTHIVVVVVVVVVVAVVVVVVVVNVETDADTTCLQ